MFQSRTGATTVRSGAMEAVVTSKRTWSLPFPVEPCATCVAPTSRAASTSFFAMSGRPSAVKSGYFPPYSAFAIIAGATYSLANSALASRTKASVAPISSAFAFTSSEGSPWPRSRYRGIRTPRRSGLQLLDVAGGPRLRPADVGDEVRHLCGCGYVRGYGEHGVLARDGAKYF